VLTSFSVLSDPMLPAMACVLWSLWAYLSLLERPTTRALWHAFFAYALGGLIMWEAYFIGPFIAVHSIFYAWTRRGRTLRVDTRIGRFNALYAHVLFIGTACTLMMAFHIWFTHHAGAWEDFLDSYRIRHSPPSAQYVIDKHWQWVDILYGRPPLVVGALWFVVWLARLAVGRARRRDIAPLTFLYVNTLYIYMFAEGSSVHLYRVFFYSGFFALAAADLTSDLYWAARRLFFRSSARAPWLPVAVAGAFVAAYFAAEVPHAWHNLIESRVMMGTHGEAHYDPEQKKLRFAAEVHARTTREERVIIHYPHLGARKEFWYYIDRNYDEIQNLRELERLKATQGKSVLILDERLLSVADRAIFDRLIAEHPVTFFENFTMVDLRSSTPRAQSFAFQPQPMSPAYRFFISHKYPPLALVKRAYLPGECEALTLGVPVATDEELPETADARLGPCHHNLLVERGDAARAAAEARELEKPLTVVDRPLASARIAAAGVRAGKLEIAYAAAGAEKGELRYQLSRDGKVGALISATPSLPLPAHWKSGQLWLDRIELPPGRWDVEVQLVDQTPAARGKLLASAPLGTFTR
ncbi:MAG TPA: hypothetical protein VF334_02140, partial [Polyangia bacterium]